MAEVYRRRGPPQTLLPNDIVAKRASAPYRHVGSE